MDVCAQMSESEGKHATGFSAHAIPESAQRDTDTESESSSEEGEAAAPSTIRVAPKQSSSSSTSRMRQLSQQHRLHAMAANVAVQEEADKQKVRSTPL